MPDRYYGLYLIPPPPIVYAISLAHHVFESEFAAITGGRFMAHCTVKGFTKLAASSSPDDFVSPLDELFAKTKSFPTSINPPWMSSGGKPGESILLWMDKSPEFQAFHNDVVEIIRPHIADDCLFTPKEHMGEKFPPHFTLVQSDIPAELTLLAQAMSLADYIYNNFPAHTFQARDLQLVEFESKDWAGQWGQTLKYKQLKGWRLAE
ncbi:MAG: 2'-5' RNA ligase family protein [Chloroflexia bacterium]